MAIINGKYLRAILGPLVLRVKDAQQKVSVRKAPGSLIGLVLQPLVKGFVFSFAGIGLLLFRLDKSLMLQRAEWRSIVINRVCYFFPVSTLDITSHPAMDDPGFHLPKKREVLFKAFKRNSALGSLKQDLPFFNAKPEIPAKNYLFFNETSPGCNNSNPVLAFSSATIFLTSSNNFFAS